MRCSVSFAYPAWKTKDAIKARKHVLNLLDDALAIETKGSHFNPAVQGGLWDGRRHVFHKNEEDGTFPAGITKRVKALLREAGYKVMRTRDKRSRLPGPTPEEISDDMLAGVTLRDDQLRVVAAALEAGCGLLHVATGGGKCLGRGTQILLADGTSVPVETIKTGDFLLGPDGRPRVVLSTTRGHGPLFRVEPVKGEPWTCNDAHILTLVHTETDDIVDVPLARWLSETKHFRHCHKQFSVGIDDFQDASDDLLVDPYFLGAWFGDGSKSVGKNGVNMVALTKPDPEIRELCEEQARVWGLQVTVDAYGGRCPTYCLSALRPQRDGNPLLDVMRGLVGPTVCVPPSYMRAPRALRLQFLAGFLDTDGELGHGRFMISQKREDWARCVWWVARSLGFCATIRTRIGRCKRKDGSVFEGVYWVVCISGHTDQIPTRIPRKQAKPRRQKKVATRTGLKVTPLEAGQYFGFTLDGDGRFLLGDFTVTHNTELAVAIIKALNGPMPRRCLFLVHTKQLLKQARERIALRLGTIEEHIGVIGDGRFDPKHITVATVQSLTRARGDAQKRVIAKYIKSIDLLILDETHHASAKTFYRFVQRVDAPWRFGMSGTPFGLADGKGLLVEAAFGPVVARVTNEELIGLGVNARPTIRMIEITEPKLDAGLDWQSVYKEGIVLNKTRNVVIAREAGVFARKEWPTLVLVRELWHGDEISGLLKEARVPHAFVHGQMPTDEVERQKDRLTEGKIYVLIASPIFGEGVDIPSVRALVIADGGQSVANVLQKIGRGLRRKQGDNRLDVVDFADTTHRWLARHSQERVSLYESEGFEVVS